MLIQGKAGIKKDQIRIPFLIRNSVTMGGLCTKKPDPDQARKKPQSSGALGFGKKLEWVIGTLKA